MRDGCPLELVSIYINIYRYIFIVPSGILEYSLKNGEGKACLFVMVI